ncbi:uncharacterized protein LOC144704529 isoform X2 [Wolffia australiana]
MAAAAVGRAVNSAKHALAAGQSIAILLHKRSFLGLPSENILACGRAPSSFIEHRNSTLDVTGLANGRLSLLRFMGSQPGNLDLVAKTENDSIGESVEEIYEKMLKSVEAKTMPPNAWLWSLIGSCNTREDIKLLFKMLQSLRIFRLSKLRINSNFNCHLCLRVTEACVRANSLDYGMKALWKHNVYGITPTIASAHYMLRHAKKNNDTKLMVDIMKLLSRNSLPLQAGTADIVFSICYNAKRWDLISKFSKVFVQADVKLHRATFDSWMEFAAKMGDPLAIWEIEKLRTNAIKHHTVSSAFSCAKGFLLEGKPASAATIINALNENLPDDKKPNIAGELQLLVSEWPLEILKRFKENERKMMAASLNKDILSMISSLKDMGLEVLVDFQEIKC